MFKMRWFRMARRVRMLGAPNKGYAPFRLRAWEKQALETGLGARLARTFPEMALVQQEAKEDRTRRMK